jgi:hypothetical protein
MANLSDMIHGRKPEVAPFIPTDPIEMLHKLLAGEITEFPQLSELGDIFQQDIFEKLKAAGLDLPGLISLGGENAKLTLENAKVLQEGGLPPEDIAAIFRTSAGQNLKSGTLFGNMGLANSLRNVGIGTLQGQLQGASLASEGGNAVQRWQQIGMGTMLPIGNQLYSPEWFTNFMAQQAAAKQATKQFKYNVEAAPDPAMSHRAAMLASLLGSFAGPGGSSMGSAISQNPNLNFAGGGGSFGGAGAGSSWGGGASAAGGNPGFASNFGSAYSGGQPQGVGGWLGSIFPGHQTTGYLQGVTPSDVSNPGYTVSTNYNTTPLPYGIAPNPFNPEEHY